MFSQLLDSIYDGLAAAGAAPTGNHDGRQAHQTSLLTIAQTIRHQERCSLLHLEARRSQVRAGLGIREAGRQASFWILGSLAGVIP